MVLKFHSTVFQNIHSLIIFIFSDEVEKEELLDGAESQNYGYGYGTKVMLAINRLYLFQQKDIKFRLKNNFVKCLVEFSLF